MSDLFIDVPDTVFQPAGLEHLSGAFSLTSLDLGPDHYSFGEPLRWELTLQNTGESILLLGSVSGTSHTSCARCLDDFDLPVVGDVDCLFVFNEGATPDDLDDDEFEVMPESHQINLAPLFKAALILEFPLVPLCKEDCLGLCPQCGSNLNEGPCNCPNDEAGQSDLPLMSDGRVSPFAVLKGLDLS